MTAPARAPRLSTAVGPPPVRAWLPPTLIMGGAVLVGAWILPPLAVGTVAVAAGILYLARGLLLSLTGATFVLLVFVMFVPIRAYAIPIPLPFQLEPYRLYLALLLVLCVVHLLAHPDYRWRPTSFLIPLGIFLGTLVLSIVINIVPLTRAGLVSTCATGLFNLLFILSVYLVIRQALRTERMVMAVLGFLAVSGAIVGFFAVVERVIHVNVFLLFGSILPLTVLRTEEDSFRAGGMRSYGSAQHPIALSVLLSMLIPVVLFLARRGGWPRNRWTRWILAGVMLLCLFGGIASAVSRTSIIVLVVMLAVTLILRPLIAISAVLIGLPFIEFGAILFPKTINSTLLSFLDVNSLIASQYTSAGWAGAGRLADLSPAFQQVAQSPFFGSGFGSRIVVGPDANSFILDDQVLGTLMEAGAVGVAGLAVFFLTPIVLLLRHSLLRRVPQRYRDLAFMVAVAAAGYAGALFFYDAFGFMQTLLVLCVLLAAGSWVLTEAPGARSRPVDALVAARAPEHVPARRAPVGASG